MKNERLKCFNNKTNTLVLYFTVSFLANEIGTYV